MDTLRNIVIFLLRILLFVFALVSLVLTAWIIIRFFGPSLADVPGVALIKGIAKGLTIDFPKIGDIKTPYEGYFELDTVFTLLAYLFLEAVLSSIKRFMESQKEKKFVYHND